MNLKTNLTNSNYQSTFLPKIESAETQIKKIIVYSALNLINKQTMLLKIEGVTMAVIQWLPLLLIDRLSYIEGLRETSEKMIKKFYDPVIKAYYLNLAILQLLGTKTDVKKVDTPAKLIKLIQDKPNLIKPTENANMWAERKGYPNVVNYPKMLKEKLNDLAKSQTTTYQNDMSGISLWQKAELDLRHEKQINMIDDLKSQGVKLAWTSSHPDCSKRCEKWQGKLFDLTATSSDLSGHRMKYKVDGNTVYCFNEVINEVQYTKKTHTPYKNNIIVGFNCRHRLIPYVPKQLPPKEYSKESVKEQREINSKLREYERKIRYLKQKAILYNSIDKKIAEQSKLEAKMLFEQYKQFAERNGYAWYKYRCDV